MAIAEKTLPNPPLVEVRMEVQFPNELRVADDRTSFHKLTKREFPFVVMPDLRELQFDYGDYSLHTESKAYRLEISMNYFRLVTIKYSGFQDFEKMFLSALGIFARHYEIADFTSFTLQYKNKLILPAGTGFAECFRISLALPDELGASLYGIKGTLAFPELGGWILLEFDPRFTGKVEEEWLNLSFSVQRRLHIADANNEVADICAKAHNRLADFFFAILHPWVIENLRRQ